MYIYLALETGRNDFFLPLAVKFSRIFSYPIEASFEPEEAD